MVSVSSEVDSSYNQMTTIAGSGTSSVQSIAGASSNEASQGAPSPEFSTSRNSEESSTSSRSLLQSQVVVFSSNTVPQYGPSASSSLNSGGQDGSMSMDGSVSGSGASPIGLGVQQTSSFDESGISGQTSSNAAGLGDSSIAPGGSYQAGLVSQTTTGTVTPAPSAAAPGNQVGSVGSTRDSGISSSVIMESTISDHGSGGNQNDPSNSGNGNAASASHDSAGASGITSGALSFEPTSSFSLHSVSPTAIISPGPQPTTTNDASWSVQSSSMNTDAGIGNGSGSAGQGNQQLDPSSDISSGGSGQQSVTGTGTNAIHIAESESKDSSTSNGPPRSTDRGNQQLDPSSGISSGNSGQQSFTMPQTNAIYISGSASRDSTISNGIPGSTDQGNPQLNPSSVISSGNIDQQSLTTVQTKATHMSGSGSRDSTISNGVSATASNPNIASLSGGSVVTPSVDPIFSSVSGHQSGTKESSTYLEASTSVQENKSSYTNLPQSQGSSLSAQIGATMISKGAYSSPGSGSLSALGFNTAHDASRTGIVSQGLTRTRPPEGSSETYQHTGPSLTISRPLGNTGTENSDSNSRSAITMPAQLTPSSSDISGEAASNITGTSLVVSPGNNFQRTSGSATTYTPPYGQLPSSAVTFGSPRPEATGNDNPTGTRTGDFNPGSLSDEALSTTITEPFQKTDISTDKEVQQR
ncbi:hypothetical protein INS49_007758 [Diaporthe citri]|uniref:uncharacterized protein n=1 Tax=Diaporthe citri TaxID=83186 RepID=UPI001C827F36|nr:uncharacterized protein INS49_007758 [Diaporthe citri]KAG6362666.1 hypothetical protein INS49_007758 [Diaporthe citri]